MKNQHAQSIPAEISDLMQKPVCMMSGEEFIVLNQYANQTTPNGELSDASSKQVNVIGVKALAAYIGCSESTIYAIKKQGILNDAIIAQVGRRIVFNAPLARDLANVYQQEQRDLRREQY